MSARKAALITGASSGIGRAVALALAEAGYDLVLSGRRSRELIESAERASAQGGKVRIEVGDLTEAATIEALVGTVEREFGKLDALIHSAGAFAQGPFEAVPSETLEGLLAANLTAPYVLTQAMRPHLLAAGLADLVFINSTQGLAASPSVGAYAATKHGLKALADALRGELNPHGVRVLSVYCGKTATAMQRRIYAERGADFAAVAEQLLQAEDVAEIIVAALRLPQTAEIIDLTIRPRQKS
jgi:short-subunit dehydrogenase